MAVFERYLEYNNKSAANLTGDDLIGLGSLLCGASINSLTNIPPQNIRLITDLYFTYYSD